MRRVLVALFALSSVACSHAAGVPLEPEQTYVLPKGTMTASLGGGFRKKSETYPRITESRTKPWVLGEWHWGVTERLTLGLPIPFSGAFLLHEGARHQSSAQWQIGGGVSSIPSSALAWSLGLTELVMLGPNSHLVFQFGGGTRHEKVRTRYDAAVAVDATLGMTLRLGPRVLITPAVQGYRRWPVASLSRLRDPEGTDGLRLGGVTDRGHLSGASQQPLVLVHLHRGWSLWENTIIDVRQGAFYEQAHAVGVRLRF
jgi:hypothetical protein